MSLWDDFDWLIAHHFYTCLYVFLFIAVISASINVYLEEEHKRKRLCKEEKLKQGQEKNSIGPLEIVSKETICFGPTPEQFQFLLQNNNTLPLAWKFYGSSIFTNHLMFQPMQGRLEEGKSTWIQVTWKPDEKFLQRYGGRVLPNVLLKWTNVPAEQLSSEPDEETDEDVDEEVTSGPTIQSTEKRPAKSNTDLREAETVPDEWFMDRPMRQKCFKINLSVASE